MEQTFGGTLRSLKIARSILNQYALDAQWEPSGQNEHGLMYSKTKDSTRETLRIEKRDVHQWVIIRTTSPVTVAQ